MKASRVTSIDSRVMRLMLFFLFLSVDTFAQPFIEVLSMTHVRTSGKMKFNNEDYKEYFNNVKVNLPVAVDSNYLLLSASQDYNRFQYGAVEQELKMLRLSIGWMQLMGRSWSATAVFIPRIASGNDRWLDDQNLQYGFAFLARKKQSSTLHYSFGVYYNAEFFGPFIIPLAGFYWTVNQGLSLYGTLPNTLTLDKSINEELHIGINYYSNTNSYRLEDAEFLRVEENQVNVFLTYYLKKIHALTLEAGHSVLRKNYSGYRLHGETTNYENQLNDGWLVRFNYSIRISTSD